MQILTKFKIPIIGIIAIAIFAGLIYAYKKNINTDISQNEDRQGIWEVMVVIRDQNLSPDPVEDAKGALKRGDVISVREEGHAWSYTEYVSYLLVKIDAKKSVVDSLLLPLEKETKEKDSEGNKIKETILARKYKIDLEKIGFTGNNTINGQPLEGQVFKEDVIVKK